MLLDTELETGKVGGPEILKYQSPLSSQFAKIREWTWRIPLSRRRVFTNPAYPVHSLTTTFSSASTEMGPR